MSDSTLTRRQVNFGLAAAGSIVIVPRRARAAEISLVHSHNLPVESPLHKRATEMWAEVAAQTNGRVQVKIDRGAAGGLDNLIKGDIAFVTLAGNGIAATVPEADVQATPYAFRNPQQVYRALDGDLGLHLRGALLGKGIYALPGGCFENGMHQITSNRPIRTAADLNGLKMRIPGTPAYQDFFKSLGAEITTVNLTRTYDALKSGMVEAQDDPWDVVELFKFYEVQKYGIITDHSWSGYNMLSSVKVWNGLPTDVQRLIETTTKKYVALQRADTDALNVELRRDLQGKGMVFIEADQASFRASLGAFYPRWKSHIGQRTWDLLEAEVGRLG